MIKKIKNILVRVILYGIIVFFCMCWFYRSKVNDYSLKMNDVMTMKNNVLLIHGKKTKSKTVKYVPPEGEIKVIVDTNEEIKVKVKTKGFTKKLGLGYIYSSTHYLELDLKLIYFNKWSLKIGTTKDFITIGISRHFLTKTFSNLEWQVVYIVPFKKINKKWGIGLRINL